MTPTPSSISTPLLAERSMVIVVGSGGVGKTTLSASLALRGALLGRKVLVLTIDPARRLAQALGIDAFGSEAKRVPLEGGAGLLDALMLDTKSTFDKLISRLAPNPETRDRILSNTLYKNISNALAGSHEYMAMEQLYAFHTEGKYDLLVLDTPPTHHALDFLDAPNRILDFLNVEIIGWFVKPYFSGPAGFGLKFLEKTTAAGLQMLENVTGSEALHDVSEFFRSFSGMYDGFKERAEKVAKLLKSDEAAYVLVTGPAPVTVDEARFFYGKLKDHGLAAGAVILNRMHADYGGPDVPPTVAGRGPAAELARRLLQNLAEMKDAARVDGEHVGRLLADLDEDVAVRRVPLFGGEVLDLQTLRAIHPYL